MCENLLDIKFYFDKGTSGNRTVVFQKKLFVLWITDDALIVRNISSILKHKLFHL